MTLHSVSIFFFFGWCWTEQTPTARAPNLDNQDFASKLTEPGISNDLVLVEVSLTQKCMSLQTPLPSVSLNFFYTIFSRQGPIRRYWWKKKEKEFLSGNFRSRCSISSSHQRPFLLDAALFLYQWGSALPKIKFWIFWSAGSNSSLSVDWRNTEPTWNKNWKVTLCYSDYVWDHNIVIIKLTFYTFFDDIRCSIRYWGRTIIMIVSVIFDQRPTTVNELRANQRLENLARLSCFTMPPKCRALSFQDKGGELCERDFI